MNESFNESLTNKPHLIRAAMVFAMAAAIASAAALAPAIAASAPPFELPRDSRVPGGVAVLELGAGIANASYRGRPVMLIPRPGKTLAIVGIPLAAKSGRHVLKTRRADAPTDNFTGSVAFAVMDKEYDSQHLTIKDKRKVNPYAADMPRIRSDIARILNAYNSFNQQLTPRTLRLLQPVQGIYSSPFGLRRYLNEQARNPHSGLDIAAPTGTPIAATESGIVIETGDYFFNGKTVFIDHGQGMVSMYCHMHTIDVEPGQTVTRGDTIGQVGSTGRSTGAHLHWSVSLNGVRVDPLLFLEDEDR